MRILLSILGVGAYFLFYWIIKDMWEASVIPETVGDIMKIELYSASIATAIICFISEVIITRLETYWCILALFISCVFAALIYNEVFPLSAGVVVLFSLVNIAMIVAVPWIADEL